MTDETLFSRTMFNPYIKDYIILASRRRHDLPEEIQSPAVFVDIKDGFWDLTDDSIITYRGDPEPLIIEGQNRGEYRPFVEMPSSRADTAACAAIMSELDNTALPVELSDALEDGGQCPASIEEKIRAAYSR